MRAGELYKKFAQLISRNKTIFFGLKFIVDLLPTIQGLKIIDIFGHDFAWKNLGECICTDLLFLDWFPSYNFFLPFYLTFENATYSIFVKDVPATPNKHTRKYVS